MSGLLLLLALTFAPGESGDPLAELDRQLLAGESLAALQAAQARVDAASDDPRALTALGHALFRLGRFEQARETLTRAVEIGGLDRAFLLLARIEQASGRSGEAAAWLARFDPQKSDDPYVLFWSAELVDRRERMRSLLERYIEVAPESQEDWVEASRGRLRLDTALDGRPVWLTESLPERVSIPLRLAWDDRGRLLGYVLEVQIGERKKPVRLMLDTGSSGLFLVERVARKWGIEWLSEETAFGGGGDRRHRNRRGLFSSFRVGELEFKDALAGTTRQEIDPYGRYHGLLGIQPFRGYRVTMDLEREELILERSDAAMEPSGEPYWMVSGQMLVDAQVSDGAPGKFLFDSGATWSILGSGYLATLESVKRRSTKDVRGFGGKVRGAEIVDGARVEFAGLTSGEAPLRAFDMSLRGAVGDVEVSGFVGLDLLSGTRIVIDTTRQRLSITKRSKRD